MRLRPWYLHRKNKKEQEEHAKAVPDAVIGATESSDHDGETDQRTRTAGLLVQLVFQYIFMRRRESPETYQANEHDADATKTIEEKRVDEIHSRRKPVVEAIQEQRE